MPPAAILSEPGETRTSTAVRAKVFNQYYVSPKSVTSRHEDPRLPQQGVPLYRTKINVRILGMTDP